MRHSESIKELAGALAKAQEEFSVASMDGKGNYNNRFATQASLMHATRKPLCKNGLAVVQGIISKDDGKKTVETMIMHSSGEWMSFEIDLILDKPTMQGLGSAITYAKRFGYSALLGIVGDEDDDGTAAEHPPSRKHSDLHPFEKPVNKRPGELPPMPPATKSSSDPGDWVVNSGEKYLGKKLKDIPSHELMRCVQLIKDTAYSNKQIISGSALQFVQKAEAYLEKNFDEEVTFKGKS